MLTDEEKDRIRLEETYRDEVRRTLATPVAKTRAERILAAANAPFVLWFPSSVVVGAAGFLYGQLQTNAAMKAKRAETVERLDIEMSGRVGLADYAVLVLRGRVAKGELLATSGQTCAVIADALDGVQSTRPAAVALEDYKDRSAASLLVELRGLVRADERLPLAHALEIQRDLQACRQSQGASSTPDTQATRPSEAAIKASVEAVDAI